MEILQKGLMNTTEFVKLPISATTSSEMSAPIGSASLDLMAPSYAATVDIRETPKLKNLISDIFDASLRKKLRHSKCPYLGQTFASYPSPRSSHEVVDLDSKFTFHVVPPPLGNPESSSSTEVEVSPKGKQLQVPNKPPGDSLVPDSG